MTTGTLMLLGLLSVLLVTMVLLDNYEQNKWHEENCPVCKERKR